MLLGAAQLRKLPPLVGTGDVQQAVGLDRRTRRGRLAGFDGTPNVVGGHRIALVAADRTVAPDERECLIQAVHGVNVLDGAVRTGILTKP